MTGVTGIYVWKLTVLIREVPRFSADKRMHFFPCVNCFSCQNIPTASRCRAVQLLKYEKNNSNNSLTSTNYISCHVSVRSANTCCWKHQPDNPWACEKLNAMTKTYFLKQFFVKENWHVLWHFTDITSDVLASQRTADDVAVFSVFIHYLQTHLLAFIKLPAKLKCNIRYTFDFF